MALLQKKFNPLFFWIGITLFWAALHSCSSAPALSKKQSFQQRGEEIGGEKQVHLRQLFKVAQWQLDMDAFDDRGQSPGMMVDIGLLLESRPGVAENGFPEMWWNFDLLAEAIPFLAALKEKQVPLFFYCFYHQQCLALENVLASTGLASDKRKIALVSKKNFSHKLQSWLAQHPKPLVVGATEDQVFHFLSPVLNRRVFKPELLAQSLREWKRRMMTLPSF